MRKCTKCVQVYSLAHHPCNYRQTKRKTGGRVVYKFEKEYSDYYYEPLYLEGGPNDFYWGRTGTVLLKPNDTVTVNSRLYKRTDRLFVDGPYICTVFELA
jgi:ribosomal protein L21E